MVNFKEGFPGEEGTDEEEKTAINVLLVTSTIC
jgi:hypothetical protein